MEAFYGEIMMLPYAFAPRFWAFCNGQILQINQNAALYSVIGNHFGGNGHSTYGLPDLMARAPLGTGHGVGLTPRSLSEKTGSEVMTVLNQQMPSHTHTLVAANTIATTDNPAGAMAGIFRVGDFSEARYHTEAPNSMLNENSIAVQGKTEPHENMQPFLAVNFCICIDGVYPVRT
ncbi:phage tail protein [Photobacterium sp. GJ3]|uniref:phage tail protein n=1 Tax=Photobacterium sp. GJ3 TaxID=2829502 RepID=UPI001B8C6283|nr:tail fiber protein [Photobacterium sp. GJ3]QUJ66495.1 phage tail protein [Photobacterium sp. GJ3]